MTDSATRPRSSRRTPPPASRPLPPVSPFARRRLIGWLTVCSLGLFALPFTVTYTMYARSQRARERVQAMAVGTSLERENQESALLDDWETVADTVRATFEDPAADPLLRRRCGEMLRLKSKDETMAIRTQRCREIRQAFDFGDFVSQERAQDKFIDEWPDYETAAHDLSRDRDLPDCVRLRCVEMIQVTSDKPAAVAIANYSRALRGYRVYFRQGNPSAATDRQAADITDDANQYQLPDARFPVGHPDSEIARRSCDLFGLASDQYYDIAEKTGGNEKISADARGQRAIRLRLALIKFGQTLQETPYQKHMKEIQENRRKSQQ